jgi:AcrR family transcriptional regulator
MPKETFFNLPIEKQEHITDIALAEFSAHTFEVASVSRIVENAGIAKGSIYQYFKNKKDLYLYLLEYATQKKLESIHVGEDHQGSSYKDFFDRLIEIITAGILYDFQNPKISRLIYNAIHEAENSKAGKIASQLIDQSANFFRPIIREAQENGEIQKELNTETVVYTVNQLTLNIGVYLERKYKLTLLDILEHPRKMITLKEEKLRHDVREVVGILKTGLKRRAG